MSRTPFSLEKLVRPFESPRVFALPANFIGGNAGPPVVTLAFGKEGASLKSLSGSSSSSHTRYMDQKAKEFDRETHVKRIENPSDPEQWVEVEVIDKLVNKRGSGPQYQKTELKLNNEED